MISLCLGFTRIPAPSPQPREADGLYFCFFSLSQGGEAASQQGDGTLAELTSFVSCLLGNTVLFACLKNFYLMYFACLGFGSFRWAQEAEPVTPSWPEADCNRVSVHAVCGLECSSSPSIQQLPDHSSFLWVAIFSSGKSFCRSDSIM